MKYKQTVCCYNNLKQSHKTKVLYSKPSLQRQYLFPKMLPLKWFCCCKESLNAAEWHIRKGWFYSYTSIEHWGDSNKYQNHMFLKLLKTLFLHKVWLIVTFWAKVSCPSNYHYNELCRCMKMKRVDYINGPHLVKTCLRAYAYSEGPNQPVLPTVC